MTRIRPIIALALSLCLIVASLALAYARGQADPAYEAVICSGFGTHVIYLDESGKPVTGPTLCPDGIASFAVDLAEAPRPEGLTEIGRVLPRVEPILFDPDEYRGAPQARGPPSLI